ncbi:MAG: energy-coupling factor ABC transporter permease [Anaerolineales bacterium]|nr:energy-coupling factor ABC transporter permease [Anaerolineales bacterium]
MNPIFADVLWLHVPDGFLSPGIAIFCWALALLAVGLAVRNARETFDERLVPLAGVMAAFIFAGQMINFPVAGGTSGHLVGASLAAIVLGPWLGILVMTAVISLQGLLFQDGGLLVMGANILAMGVIPALVTYGLYRLVVARAWRTRLIAVAAFAWLSVMAAALFVALGLGFSGTSSFRLAVPAMLGIHALIGVGEALITVAALSFIMRTRPTLLAESAEAGGKGWIVGGVIVTLLVLLLSPLASSFPDGLEWVAEENGFIHTALDAPYQLLPDYTIPFFGETALSTIVAGIVGALIVAGLTIGVVRLLRTRRHA